MEASQDSNAEIVSVVDALKPRLSPTDDPSHPEVKEGDLLRENQISEETLVELEKKMSEMNCRILEETVVELEKKISELNCQIKSCEGGSEMNMFWNPLYEDSGFNMSWNKLYKIKELVPQESQLICVAAAGHRLRMSPDTSPGEKVLSGSLN